MGLYNEFLEFENKNNLYDRKVDDVFYWEYMRMFVLMNIQESMKVTDPSVPVTKLKIKKTLIKIKDLNKYFLSKNKKNVDLLFIAHPRRVYQDGKFENIFVDRVNKFLSKKYKTLVLEEPTWSSSVDYHQAHLFPVLTDSIYFTDFLEIRFIIKKWFYKNFHKKQYKDLLREYDEIKKIVQNGLPKYQLENLNFKKVFLECTLRIKCLYKETEKLIKKIHPKIVLLHYFPSYFKTMIVDICKRNNICTIEIQHGTITADDPLVNKCLEKKVTKTVTDYIFGYGRKQVDMSYANIDRDHVKFVGFPFLEDKAKEVSKRPSFMEKNKKYILIISQSTIGTALSKFAASLSEKLANQDEYRIIFKYHPHELDRNYDILKKNNIIEIRDYMTEIYSIQKYCTCQVGVYSTALYEGLYMGIPTFIVGTIFGAEEAIKIISGFKKGVRVINSVDELVENMDTIEKPEKQDSATIFEHNSYKKYSVEVDKIMESVYEKY